MNAILLDSICVVLFVLTGLSFVPQLVNFWSGKGIRDLSFIYVFFNLFSATEQFFLLFFPVALYGNDDYVGRPLRVMDWLNFAQVSLVFTIFLGLFVFSLVTSPARLWMKITAVFIFIIQLLSTFPPAIYLHMECRKIHDVCPPDEWGESLLYGGHAFFVNPVVTVLVGSSAYFQIGRARGLSALSLLAQAVVFALLAVAWQFRIDYGSDRSGIEWYMVNGWATIDSALFAAVQLILFMATGDPEEEARPGEDEPLLAEEGSAQEDVHG